MRLLPGNEIRDKPQSVPTSSKCPMGVSSRHQRGACAVDVVSMIGRSCIAKTIPLTAGGVESGDTRSPDLQTTYPDPGSAFVFLCDGGLARNILPSRLISASNDGASLCSADGENRACEKSSASEESGSERSGRRSVTRSSQARGVSPVIRPSA